MMQEFPAASISKAIGVLALVFFCGFATGFLSYNLTESASAEQGNRFRIDATLQDLSTKLSLNPSQVEQIREILDDVIMEEAELLSQLKWNQFDARERITKYLTPEQNQQFNQMMRVAFESR
jgi:Spy/CpxP family protein refolding chaperone